MSEKKDVLREALNLVELWKKWEKKRKRQRIFKKTTPTTPGRGNFLGLLHRKDGRAKN